MFNPDTLILIAAHKYQGAQDIMQRVRFAYEECPDYIRCGVTSYNKGSMDFDNGSRIIAQTTTETTGRGMSISMIYMDEFAFVEPQNKAREFWTSLSQHCQQVVSVLLHLHPTMMMICLHNYGEVLTNYKMNMVIQQK